MGTGVNSGTLVGARHERAPSQGSTGSLVRDPSPQQQRYGHPYTTGFSKHKQSHKKQQSSQRGAEVLGMSSHSSNSDDAPIRMLPYHQRRKLMRQKQEEEEEKIIAPKQQQRQKFEQVDKMKLSEDSESGSSGNDDEIAMRAWAASGPEHTRPGPSGDTIPPRTIAAQRFRSKRPTQLDVGGAPPMHPPKHPSPHQNEVKGQTGTRQIRGEGGYRPGPSGYSGAHNGKCGMVATVGDLDLN